MEKGGTVRSGFCCNRTFHVGENQNRIQNEISNENVIKETFYLQHSIYPDFKFEML